jgi:hypothetical protein
MKPYETLNAGGIEYHFKITTANAVKLEEDLGTDLLSGMTNINKINVLAKYLFAAAVSQNDTINEIEDIYSMIDDHITDSGTYEQLQELVIQILLTSGILTQKMYDKSKALQKNFEEKEKAALQKLSS